VTSANSDRKPREGLLPVAPLRKVTHLRNTEPTDIGVVSAIRGDQGTLWELIASYVNGATDFTFGIYRMEPHQTHAKHYHPAGTEFYYVLEGRASIIVDDEVVDAEAGTCVYLPAYTVHAISTGDEPMLMAYGYNRADFREVGTINVD
jgi:oxalate decarboxylase/phosphoglucose isomerase-like protein (cupin superfamily)